MPSAPKLLPYQLDAVARCELLTARWRGVLLADEAGLGKTFVAAEIVRRARRRSQEARLVVPAGLISMWGKVMRDFGVEVQIFSHDSIANLPVAAGAWRGSLLVVDEAHHFRHPSIARSEALARLAVGTEMTLLSATPVNNSASDIVALLQLFAADDAFRCSGCISLEGSLAADDQQSLRHAVECVLVRRTASDTSLELSLPLLERRILRYSNGEESNQLLVAIAKLEFPLLPESVSRPLLHAVLSRRYSSSVAAIVESLTRMRKFCFRAIEAGSSGLKFSRRQFDRLFGTRDADAPFQDLLFGELWGMAPGEIDLAAIRSEVSRLDDAIRIAQSSNDSKLEAFRRSLPAIDSPALLFTTARATAHGLFTQLRNERRCAVVTGDRCLDSRGQKSTADVLFAAFQQGSIELLIATDRASEGVNLQRAASVIHYDLPWNPVRIDQRNGRARRLGSKQSVVGVFYLLPSDGMLRRVLTTLARKRRTARLLIESEVAPHMNPGFLVARGAWNGFVGVGSSGEQWAFVDGNQVDNRTAMDVMDRCVIEAATNAEVSEGVTRAEGMLQSLVRQVPRLSIRSSQAQLTKRLRSAGLLDRELARLLTLRYRRGVERELEELTGGHLDPLVIEVIREMLRDDLSPPFTSRLTRAIFLVPQRAV